MKTTTARRRLNGPMLRILLAALVGIAIVALATGNTIQQTDDPPRIDQSAPTTTEIVLRDSDKIDVPNPAIRPSNEAQPEVLNDIRSLNESEQKPSSPFYDGIWDDPRFIFVVARMV